MKSISETLRLGNEYSVTISTLPKAYQGLIWSDASQEHCRAMDQISLNTRQILVPPGVSCHWWKWMSLRRNGPWLNLQLDGDERDDGLTAADFITQMTSCVTMDLSARCHLAVTFACWCIPFAVTNHSDGTSRWKLSVDKKDVLVVECKSTFHAQVKQLCVNKSLKWTKVTQKNGEEKPFGNWTVMGDCPCPAHYCLIDGWNNV